LFAWCVRLSRLYVGVGTHLRSLHFHYEFDDEDDDDNADDDDDVMVARRRTYM